jgi:hypothetical protein
MPHHLMTKWEQNKPYRVDGQKVWKWVEVEVSKVIRTPYDIRCLHCHGAVRLHKQRVEHCYEGGKTRLSTQPVE